MAGRGWIIRCEVRMLRTLNQCASAGLLESLKPDMQFDLLTGGCEMFPFPFANGGQLTLIKLGHTLKVHSKGLSLEPGNGHGTD